MNERTQKFVLDAFQKYRRVFTAENRDAVLQQIQAAEQMIEEHPQAQTSLSFPLMSWLCRKAEIKAKEIHFPETQPFDTTLEWQISVSSVALRYCRYELDCDENLTYGDWFFPVCVSKELIYIEKAGSIPMNSAETLLSMETPMGKQILRGIPKSWESRDGSIEVGNLFYLIDQMRGINLYPIDSLLHHHGPFRVHIPRHLKGTEEMSQETVKKE